MHYPYLSLIWVMIMSKFCGKCGSKLDEHSCRCPVCDKEQFEFYAKNMNSKSKRKGIVIILISFLGIIILTAAFMLLDYFDIIGVGVCKNLGLKSSGTFELYSSSDYLFVSNDEQFLTFYCYPPKGYAPKLKGSYSADFVDDGQPGNSGDLKKRDGIYTVSVPIVETSPKAVEIYSVAKDGLKYYESNHLKIDIKESRSDEEKKLIEVADDSIQELLTGDSYKKSEYNKKIESVKQLLEKLSNEENPLIRKDSVFFDEESSLYSFAYINGDLGCVKIDDIDEDNEYLYGESSTDNGSNSQNSSASSKSSNALIMYDWYTDNEDILSIYQEYQRTWNDKGLSTNLIQKPTVNQYATRLANNELILIASHGSRWTLKNGWFSSPVKYSVICTHETCTEELDKQYQNDISQKNIVKANTEDGQFYWILPSFFTAHYSSGELDDTILLMDNCNGMGSDGDIDYDLASVLTGENSAAVGFHNSVCIFKVFDRKDDTYYALGYGTNYLKSMADYLMNGLTFSEAFEKTKKIYGSNQKQYFDYFWGGGNQDDEKVFPMVSGRNDVKLNISKQETKEFKVANQLLSVNSKYIVSDKNAIYLRNCIAENGRKIADKENTGELMSDGEAVYFIVKSDIKKKNEAYYDPYDIYSVNIDGSDLKCIYQCDHMLKFITVYNGYLYYMDLKFESASFHKFNLSDSSDITLHEGANPYFDESFALGNTVYLSSYLDNVGFIEKNKVYSYDLASEKIKEVSENSTLSNLATSDKLYFQTFNYTNNSKTNQHLYSVDRNGEIKKSAKYPDNYIMLSVCEDNQTAILREITPNNTYNYYTFNLVSGELNAINLRSTYLLFRANNDSKLNDTFLVGYSVNSTRKTRSVTVSKLVNGKLVDYNVDDNQYAIVSGYDYWIEDGFWVDENMDCHILSRQ